MHRTAALSRLLDTARHGGRIRIHATGIAPETLPYLATFLANDCGRTVLLIARDERHAEHLTRTLIQLNEDGRRDGLVAHLPRSLVSPYIDVSVDSRRMLEGMGIIARCAAGTRYRILTVSPAQLVAHYPRPSALADRIITIHKGDSQNREELLHSLTSAGYQRVTSVYEEGTFAVRGSLLDLFSPGTGRPVRIDFFGDDVENLSTFVAETQLTDGRITSATIFPANEVLDLSGLHQRARKKLLALADEQQIPSARVAEFTEALRNGELPPGSAALLPLLLGRTAALTEYFPPDETILLYDDLAAIEAALEVHRKTESSRFSAARELGRLVLPPDLLSHTTDELKLARYTAINTGLLDTEANVRVDLPLAVPLQGLPENQAHWPWFEQEAGRRIQQGFHIIVAARDAQECSKLATRLMRADVPARIESAALDIETLLKPPPERAVRFFTSAIEEGMFSDELALWLISSRELFDRVGRAPASTVSSAAHQEKMLTLQEGDHVVHRDYGIGQFRGVVRRLVGSGEYTCLQIEYAKDDSLFVPIHNADLVQKYVGSGKASPKLDRLGSASWETRVNKVRKATHKLAINLLELYARRAAARGHAFSAADDYFEEFTSSFRYEETPDQQQAIEEVLHDMERPQPMDRLICGDVGFGKTEVAIRAAFKAVLDGKQVAVLVPTTVLAEQHRITFSERLAAYPVTVNSLSRYKTSGQQKQVIRHLANGTLDIIIGTHRLLSRDVAIKNLGLIIVDEEHRFGVGHKERLKALRTSVDVLSLTATPIPRTMYMAMSGIRDLSIIRTPPEGRQDIRTIITNFDPDTIGNAIRAELKRDGQVFLLHNRVEDILTVQDQIQNLVPEARMLVAHGQMGEGALEKAMIQFMNKQADVLLCTTIIESGLDIPTVNTLIVNNADRFGLAQLYQIRGRVGRSTRQAFAYFIIPPVSSITGDARSRLATLEKFTSVGSGFQVANIDMELRGAGNILGGEQSGHVAAVGFDMFVHLLQEEVEQLKEQQGQPTRNDCHVEFPDLARLPEDYIPDRHQRLVIYRRIAGAEGIAQFEQLRHELLDRFGTIPETAAALLMIAELKVRARDLGITRLIGAATAIKANLEQAPDEVLQAALQLVRKQPFPISVKVPATLIIKLSENDTDVLKSARRLLSLLEEGAGSAASNRSADK